MNKVIYILHVFIFIFFSASIFAQTAQQSLETIIDEQGAFYLYANDGNFSLKNEKNLDDLNKRYTIATEAFDRIMTSGTAEQIKVAKLCFSNIYNDIAYIYSKASDEQTSLKFSKKAEEIILAFKNSDFPLNFKNKGKDVYYDFHAVEGRKEDLFYNETYSLYKQGKDSLGGYRARGSLEKESVWKVEKFKEAFIAGNNFLNLSTIPNVRKYFIQSFLLDILYNSNAQKKLEMATIDAQNALRLQTLENYTALSEADRTKAKKGFPQVLNNIEFVLNFIQFTNIIDKNEAVDTKTLNTYGNCISLLYDLDYTISANTFFKFALKKGYNDVYVLKKTGLNVATATNNKALGIEILDKITPSFQLTDCDNLEALGNYYYAFGNAAKGEILKKQAQDCKIKKQNEAIRIANDARRNERDFHFLLGLNLIPAFSNNYGVVLNIGAKKFITEFSYLNVKKQDEKFIDLDGQSIGEIQKHNWNGYVGHVAFKSVKTSFNRHAYSHTGILFALSQKTFEPFSSVVTSPDKRSFSANFAPTNKQYIAMINVGYTIVKFLGIDFYAGIGGAYNTFDGGNKDYWNKEGYTFDDKMVNNRKPNYWSLIGRAGISVGIGNR